MRRLASALLFFWAAYANAAPVQFSITQFQTDAAAIAGGSADVDSASSPPSALPLISSAVALSPAGDFASASATAATGLLSTSAEATSLAGIASAVGSASFSAMFVAPDDAITLFFDFTSSNLTDPGALSDGAVSYAYVSGQFNQAGTINTNGVHEIPLLLTAGVDSFISITVASTAATTVGGSAFNASILTFRIEDVAQVPEPAVPGLLAVALMAFGALRLLRAHRATVAK